jgi:hypothetical protein
VRGRTAAVLGVFVVMTMLVTTSATGQLAAPSDPVIQSGPDDPTKFQDATFTFTGDAGVTFRCKLDTEDSFSDCSSPQVYTGLPGGDRVFQVKAVDLLSNESGVTSYSWTIDLTDPTTSITDKPADPSADASPSFSFTSSEAGSTYECALDGGNYASCSSPNAYADLADGSHTFFVRATDPAGNTDPDGASYPWELDATAPVVTISSPGDGVVMSDPAPTISGLAETGPVDDSTVTVELYSGTSASGTPVDKWMPGVDSENASWSVISPSLDEGTYTVRASQSDDFGRPGSDTHTFNVDLQAPAVTLTSPKHGLITKNPTHVFKGSAGTDVDDDPNVDVVISQGTTVIQTMSNVPVSAGAWSSTPTDPLDDGTYTAYAEQSDAAGHTGTSNENSFTVDTTPPSDLPGAFVVGRYGYVMLRWTRPDDWGPGDELIIRRHVEGISTSTRRYRGTGTSFKDRRVTNGVPYVYELIAVDSLGNRSPGLTRRARPTGFRTPKNGATLSAPIGISWVDVPKADYSNIQVWRFRNSQLTQKLLSVWPKDNDFTLRSHWRYQGQEHRLRHGLTYRIYGWPGFGSISGANYGKSYGWVQFTVR